MDRVTSAVRALRRIHVHAPAAGSVRVVVRTRRTPIKVTPIAARRELAGRGDWVAEFVVEVGDHYSVVVDDGPPLLDPNCRDVVMTAEGSRSVVREPWPRHPQGAPLASPPVVYELHVRGLGRTFRGCIQHLDRIAATGANVLELMPVHPFDRTDNYWGYMPMVWGAVHRAYASEPDRAAEELADLVTAAHERGMHVWIDVVFNHTGEGDPSLPTHSLRGLDDANAYRRDANGRYTNDSGCGNDINPADPNVRRLVLEALDRYADLGVDGFRFDLASLLTRDGGELVRQIDEWGRGRGVALIAEPWDMGSYEVGSPVWPAGWLQWNDRFRDDVRGFLRGESGLVHAICQRVQGSPDLFADGAATSLNFVSAHDGLTMHDLTAITDDRHRSWDCGPALRMQQLKNFFTLLLLSAGTPMWVMGDEFGRTQEGHANPYDIDSPLTWVDWQRAQEWSELTDFVAALSALRRAHPPHDFRFHGVGPDVDEGFESRSLAWCAGDLYVMVNAWWQPLTFGVHEPGEWIVALETAPAATLPDAPLDGVQAVLPVADQVVVPPRSIVVLQRPPAG
ncbi:MAG: alpha-amylase family glycosyl hydrolase [Actinomycetota bacterium]|nr:alpha-amylase family glycosyl hydrolase [Actinomycetota bacterium]